MVFSGGVTVPTYAYACKDCGHAFDIQQSFTDNTLTVCPACSGNLRKKFNSVGVVFKGSGFYRTDSRDAKNSVPAAPAKTESSPAPAASASGSGSKPSTASTTASGTSAG
nr:FmdB family zinc ribbon protein [Arthrobacter jiangjiafuii]